MDVKVGVRQGIIDASMFAICRMLPCQGEDGLLLAANLVAAKAMYTSSEPMSDFASVHGQGGSFFRDLYTQPAAHILVSSRKDDSVKT